MKDSQFAGMVLLALLIIFLLGGVVLVWLAPVPADRLTPAQDDLIELTHGLMLLSLGAILGILGFVGGRRAAGRNGSGPSG